MCRGIDLPSKVDGSYNFAADIRLPGMVYASIRQGPVGTIRLQSWRRRRRLRKVGGYLGVVKQEGWVAAVASSWWAANKALDLLDPVFDDAGAIAFRTRLIGKALDAAFRQRARPPLFRSGRCYAASFAGAISFVPTSMSRQHYTLPLSLPAPPRAYRKGGRKYGQRAKHPPSAAPPLPTR
jgi:isoquinoline 1-oxidoreductase beta subunit